MRALLAYLYLIPTHADITKHVCRCFQRVVVCQGRGGDKKPEYRRRAVTIISSDVKRLAQAHRRITHAVNSPSLLYTLIPTHKQERDERVYIFGFRGITDSSRDFLRAYAGWIYGEVLIAL